MTPRDIDVLQDQFEATNERDFERAMSHYSEDVVLVVHPDAFLDAGTFEGKEAVGRYFGEWFATFEPGYHFELDLTRDLGESVLMVATHRGVEGRAASRSTTRPATTTRSATGRSPGIEIFADADAAVAAAETGE